MKKTTILPALFLMFSSVAYAEVNNTSYYCIAKRPVNQANGRNMTPSCVISGSLGKLKELIDRGDYPAAKHYLLKITWEIVG